METEPHFAGDCTKNFSRLRSRPDSEYLSAIQRAIHHSFLLMIKKYIHTILTLKIKGQFNLRAKGYTDFKLDLVDNHCNGVIAVCHFELHEIPMFVLLGLFQRKVMSV